jgi:alpha-tubulin suppressor-like RCC1 family protein
VPGILRTRRSVLSRLAAAAAVLTTALAGAAALGPSGPASAATPTMVTAGDGFSCSLISQEVWCWGRNTTGQLGVGNDTDSLVPERVGTLPIAIDVSAGHDHACAVDAASNVWCWGNNAFGEVGNGTTSVQVETPVEIPGLQASQVSAGDGSTCALTLAGTVECWGDNNYGELGDGSTADASTPQPVTGLTGISQIAAGYFHACALGLSGSVWCWGDNSGGALGYGRKSGTSDVPVSVRISGAIFIAAGSADSCAILTGGDLKCWGGNSVGQLGTGDLANHPAPVQVSGVTSGAQQVTLGQAFGCAIISTSVPTAFCWGDAAGYGKLGTGSFGQQSPVPVPVFGLTTSPTGLATGPAQLAAGTNHACVAMQTTEVECWGEGTFGDLGDGSTASRAIPAVTIGMNNQNVYSISAGTSTGCAISGLGLLDLSCWGVDAGDGGPVSTVHTSAVPVAGLPSGGASQVSAAFGGCAVVLLGGLSTGADCWGDNSKGELGNNTTTDATSAVKVKKLSAVQAVTTSDLHACALAHQGEVFCWGSNSNGQLGDGTTTDRHTPVAVTGLPAKATQIEAGGRHTCALLTDGSVWCWGKGGNGELGNGSTSDSSVPVQVTGLPPAVQIAIGGTQISGNSSCALTIAGGVFCWGWNASGQLGNGTTTDSDIPVAVIGLGSGALAIADDGSTACAVTTAATASCWGDNSVGELGDGAIGGSVTTPVAVSGFTPLGGAIDSENAGSVCGITMSGAAVCWGWNGDGQLGDGSTTNNPVPTPVLGL